MRGDVVFWDDDVQEWWCSPPRHLARHKGCWLVTIWVVLTLCCWTRNYLQLSYAHFKILFKSPINILATTLGTFSYSQLKLWHWICKRVSLKYAMFLSKSNEGLSSTFAVAMFHKWYKTTICNSRDQSKQWWNKSSWTSTNKMKFQKHQSVQSMSVTWNIQEIR